MNLCFMKVVHYIGLHYIGFIVGVFVELVLSKSACAGLLLFEYTRFLIVKYLVWLDRWMVRSSYTKRGEKKPNKILPVPQLTRIQETKQASKQKAKLPVKHHLFSIASSISFQLRQLELKPLRIYTQVLHSRDI